MDHYYKQLTSLSQPQKTTIPSISRPSSLNNQILQVVNATRGHSPFLYIWKDGWLASMATEIGPTVAIASVNFASLPDGISVKPLSVAPFDAGS